ncbi:MAG: ABC transporter ATP-binding protein [Syntrophorhabdaceae bacterium]|nr:ABC transporter ATP-binding protein [Syntrophorhabdaceae bacterium]
MDKVDTMKASPILRIHALQKEFRSNNGAAVEAVAQVSFDVPENDFVCIVGPSGCGKSTLLRMIAGLETTTSGRIDYRGEAISRPRKEIGMVFQEYSLLPWRHVLDNVALGPEFLGAPRLLREAKAMEYLRLVGMEDFWRAFPHELSGGMRQRVAIVRALANNPDVLLMDEPFGALDAHTRILLQKELLRIWENHRKTILFVTHGVDEAIYLADRIMVMSARPGRILEVIDVEMERPRARAHPSYGPLAERILAILEQESALSFCDSGTLQHNDG